MARLAPARACAAAAVLLLAPSAPAAGTPTGSPSGSTSSGTGSTGSPSGTELGEPQTSSEGVEVTTHGVVQVRPYQDAANPVATVAVHAVQRVDGATVVYWSTGSDEAPVDPAGLSEVAGTQIGARWTNGGTVGSVRLVDRAGGRVYSTVPDPGSGGPAPLAFASPLSAVPQEAGTMGVLVAVLPELPATTSVVDVSPVFGVTVPDVPVGEGYLEPTADPAGVVPLGTGWPEVDPSAVASIEEPELSVTPLTSVVEALDRSRTTTEEGDAVTVELSADVLFAFDSAELSPQARARVEEVAREVAAEASGGALDVVGHTDDQGADAYNLDLSRRRAQAVADALRPALPDLELRVDGRGEAEPVGDNGTEEGRRANRRVAVSYTRDQP